MMTLHTSFGTLGNLSLPQSRVDQPSLSYRARAIKIVAHNTTPSLITSRPLPLPSFVFPAKESSVVVPAPLNSQEPKLQTQSSAALQLEISDISNLSKFASNKTNDSPPVSPRSLNSRPGFHKRGASNIIGEKLPNTTEVSSCSKSSLMPVPTNLSIKQRRGHAHRRSAAISSGDLSVIFKPKTSISSSASLPSSPNLGNRSPLSQGSMSFSKKFNEHDIAPQIYNLPLKTPKNTRVGFSDDIQIIPRPPSMASSDSVSTMRPEHSVTNSITSIISANGFPKKSRSVSGALVDGRPRTAEPMMKREESFHLCHRPKRSGSLPTRSDTLSITLPDFSPQKANIKLSISSVNTNPTSLPTKTQLVSASSPKKSTSTGKIEEENEVVPGNVFREEYLKRRSSTSKKSKNKMFVKTLAGSILNSKTRQRKHKQSHNRHSSTAMRPVATSITNELTDPVAVSQECTRKTTDNDFSNWNPRTFSPQEDPISPIIDLDAALGPFNTPLQRNGDFLVGSQRAGTRKRIMHSAAGLGGFSGPGMHYHRRTESAPEFENSRCGIHRLGSSSTMAMEDVFEEEEDEGWESITITNNFHSSKLGLNDFKDGPQFAIEENLKQSGKSHTEGPSRFDADQKVLENCTHPKVNGPGEINNCRCQKDVSKLSSLPSGKIDGPPINIEFRDISLCKRNSDDDSSSFTFSQKSGNEDSTCTEILSLPSPSFQNSSAFINGHTSVMLSPSASPRSHSSYDAQFISNPPQSASSQCEFESLLLGEPGPELRMSVDDVPSLTSSDSISDFTTVGEALVYSCAYQKRLRDGQRSASFSAITSTRKRSSIVSLSRLISSSHGERSKLANECRASGSCEEQNRSKSSSKVKRISRLIKFWKKTEES